jgi:photosystem II stability/assembly factor-like uncharacterized protein
MKKSYFRFIVVVILILLGQNQSWGQWIQTNGPCGGIIYTLAVSGTNLFAGGNDGGVFLSTDNGTGWTDVSIGLTHLDVHALAVSGTNLFAGTWGGGVFLSTDNGTSWTEVNNGLTNKSVYTLAVSGTNLFVGTFGGGIFLSTNNGASWTEVNTGLTNKSVYSLVVSDTNFFAGTGGGVFLSTNNGASWSAVNTGLTIPYVHSIVVSGTNLFAGADGGVFLSTNNGTSWAEVNTGLTNTYVNSLFVSGTNLFAGTNGGGIFLSTNNGTSWTEVNTGLTNMDVYSFAVSGTNLFAGTNGGGVFLSTDNGTGWTEVNTGLTNHRVICLTLSGTNLFAGSNGGGVFLSTNNGTSWSAVNSGLTNTKIFTLAVSGANLFAGTWGGGVFLSTNNGASWTEINTGLTNKYISTLAVSGTNLFAGNSDGVFLSTNNGTNWTEVNTGLTNTYINCIFVSGTDLFAGTSGGGVFLSTNNGTSWTEVNTGLTNMDVYSFAVSGTNLFAGTDGGGIFLSTNNGTSWTEVNTGLTDTYVYSFLVSGTNLFAGTWRGGIFLSTNNGTSWTEINDGLTSFDIRSFVVSGTSLFAGTFGGSVWRRPLSEMITAAELSFHRGLNLMDWFWEPRSGQININRYTEEDFNTFRAMGCDAVRVPIDLLNMAGPAPGYELDTLFLKFLDLAVDRTEEEGLCIVLDNHSWDPVIGIDPTIEPILLATWTQMARHFKNRSKLVLYEVLNEPHGISDAEWNGIQERAIQAIRAEDGFHTIVVGPANWNSYLNLAAMPAYADNNLLYTFHFYSPHLFTHQGTTWGDPVPADLVGVPFPYNASAMPPLPASLAGTWWESMYNDYPQQGNETWVKSQLDNAVQFQSERNVPLLCGEFAAYPPPSPSGERAAWTRIVRSYLEENGIAWTFLTDWFFEKGTAGSFETDVDTMITSALGLNPPAQKEPASEPDTSGFTVYDDFIAHGLIENGWFASGEYDLYSKESPHEGVSCLKITGFEQYGTVSFRFSPFRDLSFLANHGSALDLWIRCASPGTQIDIRFEDTKTADPLDHPWRMSTTLNSSVVAWDGEWHHLHIPLENFVDLGSWDNDQWYNSQGLFDWKAVDRLIIDAAYHSLDGIEIFFDDIRISAPQANITFRVATPPETPSEDIVYLMGSMNFWDPGPGGTGTDGLNHDQPMLNIGANLWEQTLLSEAGTVLEYKYTRGALSKVEKGLQDQEISNRSVTVSASGVVRLDTVRKWNDIVPGLSDNAGYSMPVLYSLQQNYPNPFNPSTIIRYTLPHGTDVELTVYNTCGQRITVLVKGYQDEGEHEVRFEGGSLPEGVYFYRLKTRDFEEMKKLVLLRLSF